MRATDAPARRMRSRITGGALRAASLCLASRGEPSAGGYLRARCHGCPEPGRLTFVVGNTESVDTLNPYVGFTSRTSRSTAMVYDKLMDYGQLDYSRHAGWRHPGRTPGRPDLDVQHPARREVVRRRAADRRRRGLHVQPRHPRRSPPSAPTPQLHPEHHQREGDRQVHGGDEGKQANPGDEPADRVDPARAHLEERPESKVSTFANSNPVGSGPFT